MFTELICGCHLDHWLAMRNASCLASLFPAVSLHLSRSITVLDTIPSCISSTRRWVPCQKPTERHFLTRLVSRIQKYRENTLFEQQTYFYRRACQNMQSVLVLFEQLFQTQCQQSQFSFWGPISGAAGPFAQNNMEKDTFSTLTDM